MTNHENASPYKRKMGRPRTTWVQKLRTRLWYEHVTSACKAVGDADYSLDLHFGLFKSTAKAAPGKSRPDGDDRERAFESIRARSKIPTKMTIGGMVVDLVDLVESDPQFAGTKHTYYAPIWSLLSSALSFSETRSMLRATMESSALMRLDESQTLALLSEAPKASQERVFITCIKVCLSRRSPLDRLSLLALVYRLTLLGGRGKFVDEVRALLDDACDTFFFEHFEDLNESFLYYSETLRLLSRAPAEGASPVPGSLPYLSYPILPRAVLNVPEKWALLVQVLRGGEI